MHVMSVTSHKNGTNCSILEKLSLMDGKDKICKNEILNYEKYLHFIKELIKFWIHNYSIFLILRKLKNLLFLYIYFLSNLQSLSMIFLPVEHFLVKEFNLYEIVNTLPLQRVPLIRPI